MAINGFQNSVRLPSRIFKNQNFNSRYNSEGQLVSPCQIYLRSVERLLRCNDFRFIKMAAVRHLGFVVRLLGAPMR